MQLLQKDDTPTETPTTPQKNKSLSSVSVGFEFDLSDSHIYTHEKNKSFAELKKILESYKKLPKLHSKVVVARKGKYVRLESDGGHAEFVMEPIYDKTEIEKVIKDFTTFFKEVYKGPIKYIGSSRHSRAIHETGGYYQAVTCEQIPGLSAYSKKNIIIKKEEFKGDLQATLGIPLAHLKKLFFSETSWPSINNADWLLSDSSRKAILEADYMKEASEELKGFILLIEHYIHWLKIASIKQTDGPKITLYFMCRTNFHDIYKALDTKDKSIFESFVIARSTDKNVIFPMGYHNCTYPISAEKSLQVCEWIQSIQNPSKGVRDYIGRIEDKITSKEQKELLSGYCLHDLLSPPPFFFPHNVEQYPKYAMGLYELRANKVILLEFRYLVNMEHPKLTYQDAARIMQDFANFAFDGTRCKLSFVTSRQKSRSFDKDSKDSLLGEIKSLFGPSDEENLQTEPIPAKHTTFFVRADPPLGAMSMLSHRTTYLLPDEDEELTNPVNRF